MDEKLIIQALKSACVGENLRFQVIVKKSKLYIYINRKADKQLDYNLLTATISEAIANLKFDSLQGLWLYSRILGEIAPDWQTFIKFPLPESESVQEAEVIEDKFTQNEKAAAIITQDKNINSYCFIHNKTLLSSELLPPQLEIARIVQFFHYLSDINKQLILPLLDKYFRSAHSPDIKDFSVGIQQWFRQIRELNDDKTRKLAIWLSRYCFDTTATMSQVEAAIEREIEREKEATPELEELESDIETNTQYSFTPSHNISLSDSNMLDDENGENSKKIVLPPAVKKLLLPLGWILVTLIFILLGIHTAKSSVFISEQTPAICQNITGSSDRCRLAVNLVGEAKLNKTLKTTKLLTPSTETASLYGCQRYANVKAGVPFSNVNPNRTPVISDYGEKILPNVYLVDVRQNNFQAGEATIRVACVYTSGKDEISPVLLAADLIPNNWPQEAYGSNLTKSTVSFGFYDFLIKLGLYPIFTAIGIAIASGFNLGIKVSKSQTIYIVALILGIVQLITGQLPFLGLIANLAIPSLITLAIAFLIKDFTINWSAGYLWVAAGTLTIVATRFILYGLSFWLISWLI